MGKTPTIIADQSGAVRSAILATAGLLVLITCDIPRIMAIHSIVTLLVLLFFLLILYKIKDSFLSVYSLLHSIFLVF